MAEKYVICDKNILMDLYKTGLLGDCSSLPFEAHTTDFVIEKIAVSEQKDEIMKLSNNGHLIVDSIPQEEISDMLSLLEGDLSIADCSGWYCAKRNNWIMVSGDKKLGTRAEEDGIQVRGFLFVLDQLIEHNTIPKANAAEILEELFNLSNRLTVNAVESRLRECI